MANQSTLLSLNPLTTTDYTKLNYNQILEDVTAIIKSNPKYSTVWQDFLEGGAGQMLLEQFAYIASKIIMRADFIANESYLPTAKDPKTVVNLLKLIGYNLTPPTTSNVDITFSTNDVLPTGGLILPNPYIIETTDLEGESTNFEVLNYVVDDITGTIKYNYLDDVVISQTTQIKKAFNGTTVNENPIIVDKQENFSFFINNFPIIKDSIKIYIDNDKNKELKEINSFVDATDVSSPYPKYTVSYDNLFRATIEFGKDGFGGAWQNIVEGNSSTYVNLSVYYRIGGGIKTNINSNTIKEDVKISNLSFNIVNENPAIGGTDGETVDIAKKLAPLKTKTVDKTTTLEDYNILLKQQSALKIQHSSIDTPYTNPNKVPFLFVHNYILPQRNWDSFVNETETTTEEDLYFTIPLFKDNETIESYKQRFQIRLNNFLNLTGISELAFLDNNEKGYDNERGLIIPEFGVNAGYSTGEAKILYNYLLPKKIVGIENIFRVANFIPFSITGEVFYKKGFDANVLLKKLKDFLHEKYEISSVDFKESIKLSVLYSSIHSFEEISYFQMSNPQSDLVSNIDEIYFILPQSIIDKLPTEVKKEYDLNFIMTQVD